LNQGFLLSAMVLAAILVFITEREFLQAAGWTATAAVLSLVGLIHAYELTPSGVQNKFGIAAAPAFGAMYGLSAVLLLCLHFLGRRRGGLPESAGH
jgi:AGZA family xanthine/uracil permease-like MFS transporter